MDDETDMWSKLEMDDDLRARIMRLVLLEENGFTMSPRDMHDAAINWASAYRDFTDCPKGHPDERVLGKLLANAERALSRCVLSPDKERYARVSAIMAKWQPLESDSAQPETTEASD